MFYANFRRQILATFLAIALLACVRSYAVVINEIMASNGGVVIDSDGDTPDWVELYNPGETPVNLSGYYLSDSSSNLVKWQFPSVTVNAWGFLLIYASGKDMVSTNGQIHTNFKISAGGEPISLTSPDGVSVIDHVPAIIMPRNLSYGSTADGGMDRAYFNVPTPNQTNNNSTGYSEIADGPQFSVEGGFYAAPVEITLSTTEPNAVIYYTLDGSEPDPANLGSTLYPYKNQYPVMPGDAFGELLQRPITTFLYTQPFTITDRSEQPYELAGITTHFDYGPRLPAANIFKATPVRARAFKPNALPSDSVTHTYFVNPDIFSRYDLPVISVVTNENYLFDYYTGISVAGYLTDQWRLNNPTQAWDWRKPANSLQRGSLWERAGHFEMFANDGTKLLTQNVGIRLNGGWSRTHYRKSLRLYAQTEYGTDSEFAYPFFDGLEKRGFPGTPLESFSRIILRTSGNDFDKTLFRDAVMQHLVKHLPMDAQAYRPTVHFVNGEYWGIINIRERLDEYYFAEHYGVDPDDIVIFDRDMVVEAGYESDKQHFLDTVAFAENSDMSIEENYRWMKDRIDIGNLALYYAIEIYYDNIDWPQNNVKFWRNRTGLPDAAAPYGHDGRWRWMLYDTDYGMNLYAGSNHTRNSLDRIIGSVSPTDYSSKIFLSLLNNDEFRYSFINAFADNMNTSFTPGRVNAVIDEFNARIESSRSEHFNRWQSGGDRAGTMKTFATFRPEYMRQHIIDGFALSGTANLAVRRNTDGGLVKVNNVIIDENTVAHPMPQTPYPWIGSYFRDVPVTVAAIPQAGYQFSHWQAFVSLIAPINVDNYSFELPGTTKLLNWNNVPGWNSDTQAADSGVESSSTYPASEGVWAAYMKSGDPAVWNTTSYIIQPGDRFKLRIDARRNVHGINLYAKVYYNNNGSRIPLGDITFGPLGSSLQEYQFIVSSEFYPEAIGKNVGIELRNTTAGNTWLGFDNVRLDRIYEVPISEQDWAIWLDGQDDDSQSVDVILEYDMAMKAYFTEIPTPVELHFWNFNNSASLLVPTQTIGGASITVTPGALTVVESGTGQGFIDAHLRVNNPLGAAINIKVPSVGYENIILTYDTRRSGQGAGQQIVSYTTEGEIFNSFAVITVLDANPVRQTFDFSGVAGVSNNPDFAVRIEFAQAAGGTSGNNRFDNIAIEGTAMAGVNMPPVIDNPLDTQYITEDGQAVINVAAIFSDPDDDPLTFTAQINKDFVAGADIIGSLLTLTGLYRGDAVVTVTADDGINPPVETTVRVLVYPKAHKLADGRLIFNQWDSGTPEDVFPDNMLFLQSNINDPGIGAALDYAYWIAHDDYHADDAGVIGFPYSATGRTRMNGLGAEGVSFINTGRGRDLGGALAALDTTDIDGGVTVRWLGGTMLQNSRRYAIRLQYRIGYNGDFEDLTADGQPVEYFVQTDGHTQVFDDIELPQTLLNQPYVQLLWRYYFVDTTSGARAQLRLDDIMITAEVEMPQDLWTLAAWWLADECGQYNHCDNADISRDGKVDLEDFAIYGEMVKM